jgi:hypothetical protein
MSMPSARDDLRATIDDVAADVKELAAIEEQKKQLDPSDPRTVRLSEAAERLAHGLEIKARAERELAEETNRA